MPIELVFETHAATEDNEVGRATGWLPGRLSTAGRAQAVDLSLRRANDGLDAILTSDLGRALETVEIAFGDSGIPVFHDWRLRECDYGTQNGGPAEDLDRAAHVDVPYPSGESWEQAIARVGRCLRDVEIRWPDRRVLVIGHTATRWAFDHLIDGRAIEELVVAPFSWQEGWEYRLAP
jgi:alpha-ribazole phosphatase/probable phosphoglycerate mutase